MDRNTLIGALLIGLVLIGFTWLQQPTPEQIAERQRSEQAAAQKPAQPAAHQQRVLATTSADSTSMRPPYLTPQPEQVVELRNALLSVKLSTKGAAPVEATLAKYQDQAKKPVQLFRKGDARLNLPLRTLSNTIVNTADASFELISHSDSSAVLRMRIDSTAYLDYIYTLAKDDYRLSLRLEGKDLHHLLPANMTMQELEWSQRMPQQEQSWKFEGQYSGIYYHFPKGDVERLETSSEEHQEVQQRLQWVAFKDKYFSSVLIQQQGGLEGNQLTLQAEAEG